MRPQSGPLTAEEWEEVLDDIDDDDPGEREKVVARYVEVYAHERELACAAALCLHGQPFGFTREDVACLRAASGAVIYRDAFSGELAGDSVESRKLLDLADRIEALLPPEGA